VQVGRYEILEIIGTGATGRVARAHDPHDRPAGRHKAFVQGMGPGRSAPALHSGSARRRPTVPSFHHYAPRYGYDEATQTPYLVMEFLDGQPLDRILDRGSLPLPKALRLGRRNGHRPRCSASQGRDSW